MSSDSKLCATSQDAPPTPAVSPNNVNNKPHILIIGAGITGLVLAQALKKHGIAFTVFERDESVSARGRGWGLTIHWSLDTFLSLLPEHLVEKLPSVYVDPEASERGENGNFLFFDLRTGEERWRVPPNKRIRVSRERLRGLVMGGLDVQWSKTLETIEYPDNDTVVARFADGTEAAGTLLVGADGSRSVVRSLLLSYDPRAALNKPLPVRLLGASVVYPSSLALRMRALDPFFFQGGDPGSDAFMWFSFLDTPANNAREEKDTYECQILVSWPYRKGFGGREEPLEIPYRNEERVNLMKELVQGWTNPFYDCVMNIPGDAEVKAIGLEDFVPRVGMWENRQGRVTLMGDAAHAMTMCRSFRGEAYNHGVTDIAGLLSAILSSFPPSSSPSSTAPEPAKKQTQKEAIDSYEAEMIKRTAPAVLTSRRACLDAHDYKRIDDQSPLVSRRVMITQE
ncbi:MAG: hypothetical protein Q9174_003149 [Haloplaca sp. 1 TL-2023]